MKTAEIADHLAQAARAFPILGEVTADTLRALVRLELGHEEALDDFQSYGQSRCLAIGPEAILHVVSGNTPHAGLQSLIAGLLLGSRNFCKIPARDLPELEQFRAALPSSLASRVEISAQLAPDWLEKAGAVIAHGSDQTIEAIRRQLRPDQTYVPHGHRLSFGVIFGDPEGLSAPAAARDASLYDQQGCLSPHVFYVKGDARHYAALLADAMAIFETRTPRRALAPEESAAIASVREEIRFRASTGESVAVWESPGSTAWTVVFDENPCFTTSCLNRVVYVKPLPADLSAALHTVRPHLSAAGIWPVTADHVIDLARTGVSRICPLGSMQFPPFHWHKDGRQILAPLVRWIDWEEERA